MIAIFGAGGLTTSLKLCLAREDFQSSRAEENLALLK
jgi:hypothetical protein